MNWTLLIVDDEYWIRYKLMHQYDWMALGIGSILEASNGEEAVEVLQREPVDMVLCDMDMPFMGGAELIPWIRKHCPDTAILVLSGYSDFSMVRDAMVGGAMDYLLKPVREAELCAAVRKVMDEAKRRRGERRRARDALTQARSLQLSRCLSSDDFPDALAGLIPDELARCYRVVKVRVKASACGGAALETALIEAFGACMQLSEDRFFLNVYTRYELIAVVPGQLAQDELRERVLRLQRRFAQTEGIARSMAAIGGLVCGRERFQRACDALEELFGRLPVSAQPHRIAEGAAPSGTTANRLDPALTARLERAVRGGNADKAMELAAQCFDRERMVQEKWLYCEFATAIRGCVWLVMEACEVGQLPPEEADALYSLCESVESALKQYDSAEAISLLEQMIQVTDRRPVNGEARPSLMEEIRAYVDDNYAEPITLTSISERFHVSAPYLSRSFKKQTGQNLVSYVTACRMQAAKRLLTEGLSTIAEIAFQVGYEDYSYFSNIFRRQCGMSPREYQKMNRPKADEG